jgi:DNA-binding winged helix-turn-helix (wHTH) protein
MSPGAIYAFGPFTLDAGARRLLREGRPVSVTDRQIDVLVALVERAGEVVSKERLLETGWQDVAVGDNSLEQAISALRRALGPADEGAPYIETQARRGYRFRAAVTRSVARTSDADLDALIAPHRAFVEGRAALETLEWDAVTRARTVFAGVVKALPHYASGHIGLANALVLAFEATRADEAPDVEAVAAAVHHAREACRLDAGSGEAWATLAVALARAGQAAEGVATARRAIALDPDDWRHHLRLAYVTWGEERLRAADRTLKLLPGLALAHWLAATVHVARQAFDAAERELAAGTAEQDRQTAGTKFAGVGLHLLSGLVRLARGDERAAEQAFERELSFGLGRHVFSRQAAANACCAIGALHLRHRRDGPAREAFERALERVPGYPLALAALASCGDPPSRDACAATLDERLAGLRARHAAVDAAIAAAARDALAGQHERAADTVRAALAAVPPGTSAAWTVPVEPLLDVASHPQVWAGVLTLLRSRAS